MLTLQYESLHISGTQKNEQVKNINKFLGHPGGRGRMGGSQTSLTGRGGGADPSSSSYGHHHPHGPAPDRISQTGGGGPHHPTGPRQSCYIKQNFRTILMRNRISKFC